LRIGARGRASLGRDIVAVLIFKLAALAVIYALFYSPRTPFEPTARLAATLLGPAAATGRN
jgi:hypothetical protein